MQTNAMRMGGVMGLLPLYPGGTNSTHFTECCETAICDDQRRCPGCRSLVIGHDAESDHERGVIRWEFAYVKNVVYK